MRAKVGSCRGQAKNTPDHNPHKRKESLTDKYDNHHGMLSQQSHGSWVTPPSGKV